MGSLAKSTSLPFSVGSPFFAVAALPISQTNGRYHNAPDKSLGMGKFLAKLATVVPVLLPPPAQHEAIINERILEQVIVLKKYYRSDRWS